MNTQPLLFRAWDADMKRFRELICITYDHDRLVSITFRDGAVMCDDSNPYWFQTINVDHSIGEKDADGVPLYNNDIVLTPYGHIRVITFMNGAYHAVLPNGTKATPVHFWQLQPNSRPMKVGTRYENPEMLVDGYKYDYRKNPCLKCEDGKYERFRNKVTEEVKYVCDKCGDTQERV